MNSLTIDKMRIADDLANQIFRKEKNLVEQGLFSEFDFPIIGDNYLLDEDTCLKGNIGIWRRKEDDSAYSHERNPDLRLEWVYWADLPLISNKTSRKRIVLLGESVARGMFYDPFYNPAKALQQMIGQEMYEVIDLAKTNMDLEGLDKITHQCLDLKPDAIVVFAGNNWYFDVKSSFTHEDYEFMSNALMQNNMVVFEKYIHNRYENLVKDYLKKLGDLKNKLNIEIIFIEPEFNLIDWKSSLNEKIPIHLQPDEMKKWISLNAECERYMNGKDKAKLKVVAEELIQIDKTHPLGYELLAEAKMDTDPELARQNLELARDTNIYSRCYSKPRVHQITQRAIRNLGPPLGIEVIDSPKLFEEKSNGELPGRKYFLDYCHLSEEGIKVTMAETANRLVHALNGDKIPFEEFYNLNPELEDDKRANALINASIHNAHYGQTHDILKYLCTEALNLSNNAKDFLSDFVDLATRRTSTTICKSHIDLVEKEYTLQYGSTGIMQRIDQKMLDVELVDAMISALNEYNVNLDEEVKRLRVKEHSPNGKEVNLLESFYSSQSYDIFPGQTPQYYQSRHYQSKFRLVADSGQNLHARIVLRTPFAIDLNEFVVIKVNRMEVIKIKPFEYWKTLTFDIPNSILVKGVNQINVIWPKSHKKLIENRKSDNFISNEEDILNSLFLVFGEIHSFTVGNCS